MRTGFAAWAAHNGKTYGSEQELAARLAVWTGNVQRQLAAANDASEVAVNGLADFTREEFRAAYLGQVSKHSQAELRWGSILFALLCVRTCMLAQPLHANLLMR